ncbi:hypothetical protein [Actinoplanes campanulatus]|uniref:hypothetical protein n=1 Tax=Actinoplanes campanulatus TaxID=113559 RepID=UPI0019536824|nr:hypothetical protein [Actinoplanes capillaceus]
MTGNTGTRSEYRWRDLLAPLGSEKVIRWLMFGVAFATLPLLLNFLLAITSSREMGLDRLLGQGELLLVSAGVAASGAGELSGEAIAALRRFQVFLSGCAYLLVCTASVWFASTATLRAGGQKVNESAVANGSLVLFLAAIITGMCCVGLSRMRQ